MGPMNRIQIALLLSALVALSPGIPAQEVVRLKASDDQPLVGTFTPAKDPKQAQGGVLLLHMYRSSRERFNSLIPHLTAAGFHTLALDMRGHGDSKNDASGTPISIDRSATTDPALNPFLKMHLDAEAGLDFLLEKGAPQSKLAIVGASVGCSVALHTHCLTKTRVAAMVLMSPGLDYLGVSSSAHAKDTKPVPILILSDETEAKKRSRPLLELLPESCATLKIVEKDGVHGTRMFGEILALESEINEFLAANVLRGEAWQVPVAKDVILDGSYEDIEGLKATRMMIPQGGDAFAELRLSRDRKRLVFGLRIPERYLRRNAVVLYIDRTADNVSLTESALKLNYSPNDPEREPLLSWTGQEGRWEPKTAENIKVYSNTHHRDRWEMELAIPLDELVIDPKTGGEIRLAVEVRGQKEEDVYSKPKVAGLEYDPRTWAKTLVAGL